MGIRNYLIEGVSGSGKTSVCNELRRRGYHAINGDRELAYQGDPETGTPVEGFAHEHHIWHVDKVKDLVDNRDEAVTFFCGGSRNFSKFIDWFDGVFVLDVDFDTFIPGLLAETNANFLGPQYEIATDWYIIHSLWYNKTLLNRLHLPVPSTVAQLFNDLKVIKAKDHAVIPIEGQSGYFMLPLDGTDFPWYYNVMFPIFKKMSPHGGHSVKPAQLAYAFKNGWLSYQKNPRLKWLVATLFNDFLPYTASRQALLTAEENASSSTSSPTSPFNQFVQGKIAFLPGAGYLTQYFYGANALHPSFQIGVERMPRLTKATTPYANPAQQQSGASVGVPYSVTQEAARQHVVNWAVNFLQYLTSVKNDQYLVNNGFRFIPGIKGAVPSKTALAYKLATAGPVNWGAYPAVVPNPLSDPSAVATNKSYWEYFTLNQLGYPTVAAKVDQNNLAWANQTIAQNHYANPYK